MARARLIFNEEELRRLSEEILEDGRPALSVDLHGMARVTARKFLRNVIACFRDGYLLKVVHGYRGGTVLKRMLMEDDLGERVVERTTPDWNPGITVLKVCA